MTEKLVPTDPSHIGGHRLLARLGAGGMGVVYLGRAESGELAAVKVILPEYADQPEFRARFRREVTAARRVDSPWVVSVTGADPDASAPWLATAFVPGPSLAETVAACGPLPSRGVRVLGRMLARALTTVHEAGLVHRDIKPGNVLLTVDGPRLIDFGIAHTTDETALTSAGVVIGTPGFLAPEQARARPASPASDRTTGPPPARWTRRWPMRDPRTLPTGCPTRWYASSPTVPPRCSLSRASRRRPSTRGRRDSPRTRIPRTFPPTWCRRRAPPAAAASC